MVKVWISKIKFSDGSHFDLVKEDIVVFVGPNNSGKSQALRDILSLYTNKTSTGIVITEIEISGEGSPQEAFEYIKSNSLEKSQNGQILFSWIDGALPESEIKRQWTSKDSGLHGLRSFFCRLFTTDERLSLVSRIPPNDSDEPASHPLHYIFKHDLLADKLSNNFKDAFGLQLIRRLKVSKNLLLHVGLDPRVEGEDRVAESYIQKLDQLPHIDKQGDGMRAFAGLLIHSSVPHYSIMMIDEPEAFLHPPQARHLGRALIEDFARDRQLFISTHSGDVLKGILDTNSTNVHVIRLQRAEDITVNNAKLLNKENIQEIWKAPLLRYSNVLDGLFHERVIICESDADCTFYSAVMDWLFETEEQSIKKPDVMFIHAGGISGIDKIAKALLPLSVPVSVVVDFDALNKGELRQICSTLELEWRIISAHHKIVTDAINAIPPSPPEVTAVRENTNKLLDAEADQYLSPKASKAITELVKNRSGWAQAKVQGRTILTDPTSIVAFDTLNTAMNDKNIYVVPIGELENFCPPAANHHSSKWLAEVFDNEELKEQAFNASKGFVKRILGLPEIQQPAQTASEQLAEAQQITA
jgi:ABC-type multidrug transport system ATPase subunit